MDRLSPEQLRYLAEAYRSFADTESSFYDDFLIHRLVAMKLLPEDLDRRRPETREEIRNLTEDHPPTFEQWLWWESWVAEHSGHYALSAMTVGQLADLSWLEQQFCRAYGPDFAYYSDHGFAKKHRREPGEVKILSRDDLDELPEPDYAGFLEAVADKRSGRN